MSMKCLLGKKVGMSRLFKGEKVIPVTLLQAGPCFVTQIKTKDQDGYPAVQIGFGQRKNISKPLIGHLKKAKVKSSRYLREFRIDNVDDWKLGQEIKASVFTTGDKLTVVAISKGKGFTGVVKRHGFHGSSATHGHRHDERAPGSIGAAFPEHVFKGVKMAGRSGYGQVTVKNMEVVSVDEEKNLLAIKGSIPGAPNTLVEIRAEATVANSDKADNKK